MALPFAAYRGPDPYVFVCYSHEDSATVYPDILSLHEQGVNLWYDEGVPAGSEWRDELAQRIKHAALLLYFVSNPSAQSAHCRRELGFAQDEGVPIVAVHLEKSNLPDGLRLSLGDRQAILRHALPSAQYRAALATAASHYVATVRPSRPISPRGMFGPRWALAIGAVIVAVALAVGMVVMRDVDVGESEDDELALPAVDPRSIAVLPFANLSSDIELIYLADALTEDVIDAIAQRQIPSVASRTSSFRYRGATEDLRVIGEALGVGYVIEGSVRPSGDGLRITAQLIRVADGFHVWSKQFDRSIEEVGDGKRGVAWEIGLMARMQLIFDVSVLYFSYFYSSENDAAMGYVQQAYGQYLRLAAGEGGSWTMITNFYEKAVELDPELYIAHLWLTNIYMQRADFDLTVDAARQRAHASLERAFALVPRGTESEALSQLGQLAVREYDYESAEAALLKSLQLTPGRTWSNFHLARLYMQQGRKGETAAMLRIAQEIDHTNEPSIFSIVWGLAHYALGDYALALEGWRQALLVTPYPWLRSRLLRFMALAEIARGERAAAETLIDEAWALTGDREPFAFIAVLARVGRTDEAHRLREKWDPEIYSREVDYLVDFRYFDAVQNFLALGEVDNAIAWLRRGLAAADVATPQFVRLATYLDVLRDEPGFQDVLSDLEALEASKGRAGRPSP